MKKWLISDRNVEKDSYVWNMVGSMVHAFQQVVLLMVVTRVCGLSEAGLLTIAFANGNLFLAVGKYGMRYYQVSDRENSFSFGEYFVSRIITTALMVGIAVLYLLVVGSRNNYSGYKTLTILWLALFKAVDSLEDVIHGFYQQNGRLDIAAKSWSIRLGSSVLLMGACIIFSKDILLSIQIATIYATVVFLWLTHDTSGLFPRNMKINCRHVLGLIINCFPLFLGAFLSLYIGNAPKYAIDSQLTDDLQAIYGFIAMPVFVIGLLNGFIFNPMIQNLSVLWHEKNYSFFIHKIMRQAGIIVLITVAAILGAYLLGIPVLSVIYHADLSGYRMELLILLAGGGFLSLSGLMNTALTIIRYQWSLMAGYVLVSFLALFLSDKIVALYGILGASLLYLVLMIGLCVSFFGFFAFGVSRFVHAK